MSLKPAVRIGLNAVGGILGVGGLLTLMSGIAHFIDPSNLADDGGAFAAAATFDEVIWRIAVSFLAFAVGTGICVRLGRD